MAQVPSIHGVPKPYKSLPKRKRDFIQRYLRSGDAVKAFRDSGYKISNERSEKARASKLLRDCAPYLDEQLREYTSSVEMAVLGTKVLVELAEDTDINPQVRLNAAKEVRATALPEGPKESIVTHRHEDHTAKSLDDRIEALQKQLETYDE